MSKILEFLKGKKTYIVAVVTFILGGLTAIGIEIPPMVYVLLAGIGITTVRSAISHINDDK
jgi:hypothetical protein